jgi:hypothetical protein
MQVVLHAGAHCTDEDRILKCLLKNRGEFAEIGSAVPPPGRYRRLLRKTVQALETSDPAPNARDLLIETILDGEAADRLLLSERNLFCMASFAVRGASFYHRADSRLAEFKRLFAGDQIELFLSIRNPASFLPALFEKAGVEDLMTLLRGTDPRELYWSELILRLRNAHPDVPITLWCNEDSPLIWAQIIREMAGLNPGTKIKGGFDLLSEIMTKEGMKRFRDYLAKHPVMTEIQKRRVMVAFLDKFARPDAIEEELDVPGWTEELVDELTEAYDEDVFEIARIPGVNLITP